CKLCFESCNTLGSLWAFVIKGGESIHLQLAETDQKGGFQLLHAPPTRVGAACITHVAGTAKIDSALWRPTLIDDVHRIAAGAAASKTLKKVHRASFPARRALTTALRSCLCAPENFLFYDFRIEIGNRVAVWLPVPLPM